MIAILLSIAVAQPPQAAFSIKDVAFQPEAKLVSAVGPKIRMGRHAVGVLFDNPSFDRIFVDAVGPAMTRISLRPKWLAPYQTALKKFGIDATHASVKKLPTPQTAIPLTRNSLEVVGASGVPVSPKTHKPFKLNYIECAVVNKDRTRELRPQILAATGDAKIKLIRKCYDWFSEIDLSQ